MKQLLTHMIVPLLFLLASLSVYLACERALSPIIESGSALIAELEVELKNEPERTASVSPGYHLEAQKELQNFHISLLSALKHFLVGGALGLFLVGTCINAYAYNKIPKNS